MGRPRSMFGPLRQYWQDCNRYDRAKQARQRRYRKTYDKKRPKCRCAAYPWPHRPGGGFCRHPNPPTACWKDIKAAERAVEITARVAKFRAKWGEPTPEQMADLIALSPKRPYRKRYAGLRRQIARNNGLHPIKDRAAIESLMSQALALAKELKRRCPRVKYRNMVITENGLRGEFQSAGPKM